MPLAGATVLPMTTVVYDRRVSPEFLAHFDADAPGGGVMSPLVTYANKALFPVDLCFRKSKAGREHATLYVGLTGVLTVHSGKKGLLSLEAHPTHKKAGRFDSGWSKPMTPARLAEVWAEVELYLDRVIPEAARTHGSKEGAVQAAVASYTSPDRVVVDREVTPSFGSSGEKRSFMSACQQPILGALGAANLDFSGKPKKLGNECDALGIDSDGRVLAIEVKPLSGSSVAWVAAQAAMYARILQGWIEHDQQPGQEPDTVLRQMLAQRRRVGLASGSFDVEVPMRVVPVVALQRGASPEMVRRMLAVRDALAKVDLGVEPIEIYEVTLLGEMLPLDESRHADGRPRHRRDYAARANQSLAAWKAATSTLPDEARGPGVVRNRVGEDVEVDYCLSKEFAAYNLLPEVRQPALRLFKELGIAWHQGVAGGPSSHLRSSQVQCVNALGQMMAEPERIIRAFGEVLDIADVRDFGAIDSSETGRYLTFEFIGATDYFGEGGKGKRTRGSHSTSVDAAFAYTNNAGVDELALVEWKFTENYPSADSKAPAKEAERRRRYINALAAPDSPIDIADVEPADLFHEPIYQLVRQQLLARELELDPSVKAQVVRVVHVLSPENAAYARSYIAPGLRSLGSTPAEVWTKLLRLPDRFVKVDPVTFLDPDITSREYLQRYGMPDTT